MENNVGRILLLKYYYICIIIEIIIRYDFISEWYNVCFCELLFV